MLLSACTEHIDTSVRYVFTTNTVISYLEKHEEYSDYLRLLGKTPVSSVSKTTLKQLLTARGNYTIFAPTNEAIQLYLDTLVKQDIIDEASWNGFRDSASLDSIERVIVYNSIIDGGDNNKFATYDFPTTDQAEIPLANMYGRKLTVAYDKSDPEAISVNDCPLDIANRDIPVLNGFIHQVKRVIAPSNDALADLLSDIIGRKEEGYYVAALLAEAVGMIDTLSRVRDDAYEMLYLYGQVPDQNTGNRIKWAPAHRYIGFTYFAETDAFWSSALGKPATEISVRDVVDYLIQNDVYPDAKRDDDYTDRDNLLNRFVTYHFLPMVLGPDRLVIHYNERGYDPVFETRGVAMAEFYTTMGKPRLLKVFESRESEGIYLNRFPKLDNGRRGSYHELSCDPDKEGIRVGTPNREGKYNVQNGIIYPLDRLLIYDEQTRNNMGRERIRWDACAMFPEMMTNDIRLPVLTDQRHLDAGFPIDNIYRYLDNAWISEGTEMAYSSGKTRAFRNYLSDEFQLWGIMDVTLRMPPVPRRGTYELRFAIQNGGNERSMVQCYWGTDRDALYATGLPLDTRIGGRETHTAAGNFPSGVGWEEDTEDDDYNAEIDKKLRNKDYMKSVEIMCSGNPGNSTSMRADVGCIRRIIVRQTMDPDETYYLRFKAVLDDAKKFLYVDFFEYCPKEVYDNPETPEDIW
jgi:uncharacterized surface protein with fasciclin (FAS1) repeats